MFTVGSTILMKVMKDVLNHTFKQILCFAEDFRQTLNIKKELVVKSNLNCSLYQTNKQSKSTRIHMHRHVHTLFKGNEATTTVKWLKVELWSTQYNCIVLGQEHNRTEMYGLKNIKKRTKSAKKGNNWSSAFGMLDSWNKTFVQFPDKVHPRHSF